MVRITRNYLIRHADTICMMQKRQKNNSDKEFFQKITHLKLQGRYIDKMGKLEDCSNVRILYLQNNLLTQIHNMENFTSVTHLYLQRNKITKMENLSALVHLRKLYLGYNEITVLEGLEGITGLREVHIEFQSIPMGESVHFDPRTMANISTTLEVLNVSGNCLVTLSELRKMSALRELIASDNALGDLHDLGDVLKTIPNLIKLVLSNNPIVRSRQYKDTIIVSAKRLKWLDEKEILDGSRQFIEAFISMRCSRRGSHKDSKIAAHERQKLLPQSKMVHFNELSKPSKLSSVSNPQLFSPWILRPNVNGSVEEKPRPFKTRSTSSISASTQL